jgi:hypothetical protein
MGSKIHQQLRANVMLFRNTEGQICRRKPEQRSNKSDVRRT